MGIKIKTGGFLTTIQDMGRFCYQETGGHTLCVPGKHPRWK